MSREKLIRDLKKKNPHLKKTELSNIIEFFNTCIKKALKENKNIELRGFGTFFTKKTKEKYSARNPKTGELIYIPERNRVKFKASKNLNRKINEK